MAQALQKRLLLDIETKRLQELASYSFLRPGNDPSFDHIVKLAAKIFNVPTSLLSFVEQDAQWFAARTGFEPCETSRDVSFCDRIFGWHLDKQPKFLHGRDCSRYR